MYNIELLHKKSSIDPKDKTITVSISSFDYENIQQIAKEKGLSLSAITREALWYFQDRESKHKISKARRKRLKLAKLKGTHTKREWDKLVKIFGGVCLRCGDPNKPITKDHIIPLHKGGDDTIQNLQPLCLECNVGNKAGLNWRKKRFLELSTEAREELLHYE